MDHCIGKERHVTYEVMLYHIYGFKLKILVRILILVLLVELYSNYNNKKDSGTLGLKVQYLNHPPIHFKMSVN